MWHRRETRRQTEKTKINLRLEEKPVYSTRSSLEDTWLHEDERTKLEIYEKLRPKQRLFAEAYLETRGNGPDAAQKAYNCSNRNSARVMAHKLLHNPNVRAYVDSLLNEDGLAERVVTSLRDQLKATKYLKGNGQLMKFPDWKARQAARQEWMKLRGLICNNCPRLS